MSDSIGLHQWLESPVEVENDETASSDPYETPRQPRSPTPHLKEEPDDDSFDEFWNSLLNSRSPNSGPRADSEGDEFDVLLKDSQQLRSPTPGTCADSEEDVFNELGDDPTELVALRQKKLHHIYFSGDSLRLRIPERRWLPKLLSRMTWEHSATQSCFTPRDCHVAQHRPIKDHQAFQALADFSLVEHLTLEAYERHHKQLMKQPPLSAFISLNDSLEPAKVRARLRYYFRSPKGRRITLAQISLAGLVPAEFIISHVNEDNIRKKLAIPIWVRDICRPADGRPITVEQFEASGADLYMSVLEQRAGGWKVSNAWEHGQDYEYMAGGFIDKKYITAVIPYDGEEFYPGECGEKGQCEDPNGFIFDRSIELGQWREKSVIKRRVPPDDDGEDRPLKRHCS